MIKARNKPFFFGRTQMDTVATDTANRCPQVFCEKFWEQECEKIKKNLMDELKILHIDFEDKDEDKVFLLAQIKQEKIRFGPRKMKNVNIDFPGLDQLAESMAEKLPELHRQALIFSMGPPNSKKMLKLKVNRSSQELQESQLCSLFSNSTSSIWVTL